MWSITSLHLLNIYRCDDASTIVKYSKEVIFARVDKILMGHKVVIDAYGSIEIEKHEQATKKKYLFRPKANIQTYELSQRQSQVPINPLNAN